MKKILACLAIALFGAFAVPQAAQAQGETYSITIGSAGSVAKIDLGRAQHNLERCLTNSLPEGCTQAQVCVAANVAGGASCTANAAVAAGQRIYANSQGGRESFIANELVRASMDAFVQKQSHLDVNKARAFCASSTQPQRDAVCSAFGLGAGCFVCTF